MTGVDPPIRLRVHLLDPSAVELEPVRDDERRQANRYRHLEARTSYLAARAELRQRLSQAAHEFLDLRVAPLAWEFGAGPHGKPTVRGPAAARSLHFNLSKTRGRLLLAISPDGPMGVDIERVEDRHDALALARRYLHPSEQRWLERRPSAGRGLDFARLWTLKEAYLKARGCGLSSGLDWFGFEMDGPEPRIHFEPGSHDDPRAWWFSQRETQGYVLALACRGVIRC